MSLKVTASLLLCPHLLYILDNFICQKSITPKMHPNVQCWCSTAWLRKIPIICNYQARVFNYWESISCHAQDKESIKWCGLQLKILDIRRNAAEQYAGTPHTNVSKMAEHVLCTIIYISMYCNDIMCQLVSISFFFRRAPKDSVYGFSASTDLELHDVYGVVSRCKG